MPEILTKPNKRRAKKRHGFIKRNKTRSGKAVIKRRRLKGRKRIAK